MLVIQDMNDEDQRNLEKQLHHYDLEQIKIDYDKIISFGFYEEGQMIAGIKAKLEGYKMMYIEVLFVNEKYRRLGLGKALVNLVEQKAVLEGVNTIRLDTFSWQGRDFYLSLGYEQIASYEIDSGVFEYFLIKKL